MLLNPALRIARAVEEHLEKTTGKCKLIDT